MSDGNGVLVPGPQLKAMQEEIARLRSGYLADENGNEYVAVCVLKEKIRELEGERSAALNDRDKFHNYWYSAAKRADRFEKALKEIRGMLSAHEYAIRADGGNTNWTVMDEKVRAALAGTGEKE
jgi:hypothetical protein